MLQLTPLFLRPIHIFWDIVLQLSHGSVATAPVIWGIYVATLTPCFKTFTALKLYVRGTSRPDENQADR